MPVEAARDAVVAVDRDPAAAQEVARADAVEDRVEPARRPRAVVRLQPDEDVGEQRCSVALDAVDRAKRSRRDAHIAGQLLARLVHVQPDPENDDPVPRLGEDARDLAPVDHHVVRPFDLRRELERVLDRLRDGEAGDE